MTNPSAAEVPIWRDVRPLEADILLRRSVLGPECRAPTPARWSVDNRRGHARTDHPDLGMGVGPADDP
jgi:hypothetical protein